MTIQTGDRTGRRATRALLGWVVFAVALVGSGAALIAAMDVAAVPHVPVSLTAMGELQRTLHALESSARQPDTWDVALFGDSLTVSYKPDHRLPVQLQSAATRLLADGPAVRVHPIATEGMSPFIHYFLSDRVVRGGPDQAVIAMNLASISGVWQVLLARRELSGWLPLSRLPEALLLPLYWIDLSLDRYLLYASIVELGGFEKWRALSQQQARVGRAWRELEDRLGTIGPEEEYDYHARIRFAGYVEESRTDQPDRFNALGLRRRYGLVLDGVAPDHPVLRVLGATLRRFREAGIPAIVFVEPMNIEQLGEVGLDASHLGESIAAVASVARENGAEFLDLHDAFGAAWYSDAPGHYRSDDEHDGPREIASRLAPYVARAARSGR